MKKKHFFLGFLAFWCGLSTLFAQVTIGEIKDPQDFSILELISKTRGLRLPQLTTGERKAISVQGNSLANGLVIYNTTIDCIEYWNGKKWVSLCAGTADITFEGDVDPTKPSFSASGGKRTPFIPQDNPDCTEQDPPFTFTVMSGADYLYVAVLDETTGEFSVEMDENLTALARTAILRITNNCTGEYKEFLFVQDGAAGLCNSGLGAPALAAQNDTKLCSKVAVYLYLSAPAGTDGTGYVWSRNGKEIARDVANYIATQPGTYKVYGGAIGCSVPAVASITVTAASTTLAPDPVSIIVGQNSGLVCDASSTTTIFATAASSGTIVWYKDGEKQSGLIGSSILAGLGRWCAVVEENGCSSVPSNEIVVQLEPGGGNQITQPQFSINGTAAGSEVGVCANGTLLLEVVNPEADVTYTWYVNNDVKGYGERYELAMADISGEFVLQCRATGVSKCSSAGVSKIKILQSPGPERPALSSSTGNVICGSSVVLSTTSNAAKYRWYKDYVLKAETLHPVNVYNASELGTYTLKVVDVGGCVSEMSLPLVISEYSAYGAVSISPLIAELNTGESRVFTADINPVDATSTYKWTITGATPQTSLTGKQVMVNFDGVGQASISVTATNACTASGVTASTTVVVKPNCPAVSISSYSPASKKGEIIASGSLSLSIAPNGNFDNYTYQWYKDGTPIPNANLQTYSATGGGAYTCVVTSKCDPYLKATSDAFNITHIPIPSIAGGGTLSGRTAFDIASSANNNSECGNISGRYRSNFAEAITNTQTYTFTKPSGTVNDVYYAIIDNEGVLQPSQPLSGKLKDGSMTASSLGLTLSFKTNLNDANASPKIVGLKYDGAALVKVYIIYNDGGKNVAVSKTLRIQDCGSCRAKVGANYRTFMCYNVGAKSEIDPFVPSNDMKGNFYKYGSKTVYTTTFNKDIPSSAWGTNSGTANTSTNSTTKGGNDPCPDGWRVPSYDELNALLNVTNNPRTVVVGPDGRKGSMLGDALMIGYFGYHTNSSNRSQDNAQGWLWSNRTKDGNKAYDFCIGSENKMSESNRYSTDNVRCISY